MLGTAVQPSRTAATAAYYHSIYGQRWRGGRLLFVKGIQIPLPVELLTAFSRKKQPPNGAVVTKDVAPNAVVAGVPARFLRGVDDPG